MRHGSSVWHTKEHVGDPEEKMSKPRHLAEVLCTRAFLEAGSPGQRKTFSEMERTAAFMFLRKAQRRVLCLRGKEEELLFFPRGRQRTLKTLSGLKSVLRGEKDELSSRQATLSRDSLPGLCLTGGEQLHSFWWWSLPMGV